MLTFLLPFVGRMFFFEKKNQKTLIRLEPRRSILRGSNV